MGERVGTKLYRLSGGPGHDIYLFWCPGCKKTHPFTVNHPDPKAPKWSWNGDGDKPTFSPSLLVNQHDPSTRCHLFLREGVLQLLGDCHHDLAGQTVPCPDFKVD